MYQKEEELLPRKMRKTGTENTDQQEKRHKFAAEKRGLHFAAFFSI
jgi:hypothetical protein